jgi:callose synthase
MQRNEAFRVAYIDIVESLKDEKTHMEFFSKPVKANVDWKE